MIKTTIEEFTKSYVSKRDYERLALESFIEDEFGHGDVGAIRRILLRANIVSIRQLHLVNEERIKSVRNCGEKRFKQIMWLKEIIKAKLSEGE